MKKANFDCTHLLQTPHGHGLVAERTPILRLNHSLRFLTCGLRWFISVEEIEEPQKLPLRNLEAVREF